MINQKLVDYVQKTLNSGYDISAIKNKLVTLGYSEIDVDDAINYVKSQSLQQQGGTKMANINNTQYAGFWIRFSAMVWDAIIIGIPSIIIQILLIWATGIKSMTYLVTLAIVGITIYMDGVKGGTPGKLILGLRINNAKGQFIGIPIAILRYIGKIISGIILGIGYLMIAWDSKKQGLHDKIAKTFVVKTPGVERKGLAITGIVLGFLLPILLIILIFVGISALILGRLSTASLTKP